MKTLWNKWIIIIHTVCNFWPAVLPAFGSCRVCCSYPGPRRCDTSSYLSYVIVCDSLVKYAAPAASRLVHVAIGQMLQTPPYLCEHAHNEDWETQGRLSEIACLRFSEAR